MEHLVVVTILLLVGGGGSADVCTDIDQTACQLLHAKEPNLCQDPVLSGACKRYCGQCPITCNFCPQTVLDPRECNETSTCGYGEVCYMMEMTDFDNHHGFKGGCISKDLCITDSQTALVGRRSASHLKLDCCSEDFCNNIVITTTTEKITTEAHHYLTTLAQHHFTTHRPLHCADDTSYNCHQETSLFGGLLVSKHNCNNNVFQHHCRHTCGLC